MSGGEEYKFTDSDLDNFMSVATKLIKEAGQMIAKAINDQVRWSTQVFVVKSRSIRLP